MSEVQTTRVYRVLRGVPQTRLQEGDLLWLIGSRRSCLGGYVGNFQHVYEHRAPNGTPTGIYSPDGRPVPNIPMAFVEPVATQ